MILFQNGTNTKTANFPSDHQISLNRRRLYVTRYQMHDQSSHFTSQPAPVSLELIQA